MEIIGKENDHVKIDVEQPNLIEFSDLKFTIKKGSEETQVLNGVCGKLQVGRLTAVLGPSGAGKSSLLNVLSGFKCSGVEGSILVNGKERNLKKFQRISSYISQEFPVLDYLTVYETIMVSAHLKLGSTVSNEGKTKIVLDILELLNMEKCSKTLAMNLSGGEKKRLSIAVELVTNPPVMFCDEPTSGLDNVSSLQVLTYLQKLAKGGRIIVCVIHQPSSKLINLFDDVMVVAQGRTLYCGSLDDMVGYFRDNGFSCPQYYNQSDYVIEVANNGSDSGVLSLMQKMTNKFEAITENVMNFNEINEKSQMLKKNNVLNTSKLLDNNSGISRKFPVNEWQQFCILTKRNYITMWRNMLAIKIRLVCHILTGFFIGCIFYNVGNDATRTITNISCLFFASILIFFGNVLPGLVTCPPDTPVFIREHLNGWYSISAYYLAKILSEVPLQIVLPTFFAIPLYCLSGQPMESDRLLMFWLLTVLMAFVGMAMGMTLGSSFPLPVAIFIVPIATVPLFVFSGFFIRINELPAIFRPLTYTSFIRFNLEGYMQAIYGYGRETIPCMADFCYYKSPQKILKDMSMNGEVYWFDVIALIISAILFYILLYVSLVIRIKRAR